MGIGRIQIDHQGNAGLGGVVAAADTKPTNFDQARQSRRRMHHQLVAMLPDIDAVIAH